MEEPTNVSSLVVARDKKKNLLASALVRAIAKNGEQIYLNALVDPGSQSASITEEAVQLLKLPTKNIIADILRKSTDVSLMSRFNDNFVLTANALVTN